MKRLLVLLILLAAAAHGQQGRERARDEVRRTAEFITAHAQFVRSADDPRVRNLWQMAESELAAAEENLRRERFFLAVKFALAARGHARDAVELLRRAASPERLRRELERTDALLARVREAIGPAGNRRADELLARAEEWQARARAAFAEKRFPAALRLGLAARDLGLRAWEMVRGGGGPELAERAVAETDALLREWADDIRSSGNSAAIRLLDQALPRQEQARAHLAAKRFKAALADAGVARRLIKRAVELLPAGRER